jgi:bifunctional DNA-binding transcriptional regulator/antitoxin component of YhaV-PrlF toxin-antitoxin module
MTATLTINSAGQITLPETVQRLFKARPGESLQAEVTAERIEIIKEVPSLSATTRTAAGRLVLASETIPVSAARAVREERDALAGSAIRR